MYQNYVCVGRLTRDVEVRYIQSGTAVCDLGVAVNEKKKVGDEWKEETLFLDVTVWGKQAELVAKYKKRGDLLLINGKLKMNKWEKDGKPFSKITVECKDVVFLSSNLKNKEINEDDTVSNDIEEINDDLPF